KQLDASQGELKGIAGQSADLWRRVADAFQESRAWLRCAIAAVALERYRVAKKHWPESLSGLTPVFLPELPLDPSDGSPLRYRRLDGGVVVYALGPNGTDDGGQVARPDTKQPGLDLGFRLWDVAQRRRPAEARNEPKEVMAP